jgi:hypothetical protein
MQPDTTGIITRIKDTFQEHDPAPVGGLVAGGCVLEGHSRTADAARYEDRGVNSVRLCDGRVAEALRYVGRR